MNPTRTELSKLKKQLDMSVRGHKLLKDKQDELVRRFVNIARESVSLRKSVEQALLQIRERALLAKGAYPDQTVLQQEVFLKPSVLAQINIKNIMGVHVPEISFLREDTKPAAFSSVSPALQESKAAMLRLLPDLLLLAQKEKVLIMLSGEIEKMRRRVNALEYLTIPQLEETIRFIKMRLEDMERERITRLIKMEHMQT